MINPNSPIHVSVATDYLPEYSDPERRIFTYRYEVTLHNQSEHTAQLLKRHWLITNDRGKVIHHMRGSGVIGQHPEIPPGATFRYTSTARVNSPVAAMQGFYEMIDDRGESFVTEVDPFCLATPTLVN